MNFNDNFYRNGGEFDGESRRLEAFAIERESAARRLRFLVAALGVLLTISLLPFVAERIVYSTTRGAERAKREEATKFLAENPNADAKTRIPFVVKKVAPSVVGIKTDLFRPDFFGNGVHQQGQGSGVVVDESGFIVTNFHVICENGALVDGVQIVLSDGRTISNGIQLVAFDEKLDLAVLKIEATGLAAIEWGDADALEVGESVLALGNPFGLAKTVTVGIVSAKERFLVDERGVVSQEYLQTDAAVNPGNSGGALVDDRGRLVGINAAIFGEQFQGISFAIPSPLVKNVCDAAIAGYRGGKGAR